ncbi:unnamed protein product [Lactuca saligna]|uniref:Uncharacterized protein n=1 Tax=Lactuca saligna TaxID=75948 RepID=A0AA35YT24_LACSI|nr:unnamed protein product [Lactuca saligna]
MLLLNQPYKQDSWKVAIALFILQLRKQLQEMIEGEGKERRIEDEFEPTILSNKYKTEKGEYIREIDIPERIQISEECTGPPPTDEMIIEEEILEFMHVQKLDVPFIAMYKKEECMSLFKDLKPQDDKESENKSEKKPTLKWH